MKDLEITITGPGERPDFFTVDPSTFEGDIDKLYTTFKDQGLTQLLQEAFECSACPIFQSLANASLYEDAIFLVPGRKNGKITPYVSCDALLDNSAKPIKEIIFSSCQDRSVNLVLSESISG